MATSEPFSLRIKRMVMTSPITYCLVSIATTLPRGEIERNVSAVCSIPFPPVPHEAVLNVTPLQVDSVHGLVADGTFGPAAVAQRQVVQHARPAEDVSTAGDPRSHRRVQTDGARRHLVTVDALQRSEK